MKTCTYRVLALCCGLWMPAVALAAPAKGGFALALRARVADASRTRETVFEVKPQQAPLVFKRLSKWRSDDVEVELLPRLVERNAMLLSYRVLKNQSGRWVPILAGDMRATVGQVTHLFAGDQKYGNLIDLSLRVKSEGDSGSGLPSEGAGTSGAATTGNPALFDRI
jgi:hypothetical protein